MRVNHAKSSMVGIHVEEPWISRLASIIGCKVDIWPLNYLGLPLGEYS